MSRRSAYWTRERIIEAIVAWYDQHGDPPRSVEWGIATDTSPHRSTITTMFGSWNAAIAAAGFRPVPRRGRPAECPHCGGDLTGRAA